MDICTDAIRPCPLWQARLQRLPHDWLSLQTSPRLQERAIAQQTDQSQRDRLNEEKMKQRRASTNAFLFRRRAASSPWWRSWRLGRARWCRRTWCPPSAHPPGRRPLGGPPHTGTPDNRRASGSRRRRVSVFFPVYFTSQRCISYLPGVNAWLCGRVCCWWPARPPCSSGRSSPSRRERRCSLRSAPASWTAPTAENGGTDFTKAQKKQCNMDKIHNCHLK